MPMLLKKCPKKIISKRAWEMIPCGHYDGHVGRAARKKNAIVIKMPRAFKHCMVLNLIRTA